MNRLLDEYTARVKQHTVLKGEKTYTKLKNQPSNSWIILSEAEHCIHGTGLT